MQSNSAGITVLLGIESHGVFSFRLRDLPVYRFGGELEGEGSMSIKCVQSDIGKLRLPQPLMRALGGSQNL